MWPLCLIVVQSSIMGGVGRLYHTQWHFGHKSFRSPLFQMIHMGQTRPLGLNFQLIWKEPVYIKGERKIKICERKRMKFFNMHMLVKVFPGDDPCPIFEWGWSDDAGHLVSFTNPPTHSDQERFQYRRCLLWWTYYDLFCKYQKMWCLSDPSTWWSRWSNYKMSQVLCQNCQFSQQNWAV